MSMLETQSIPSAQFKQKCLQLMNEVEKNRSELVITKHGRPVAKLVSVPTLNETTASILAPLRNRKKLRTVSDKILMEPVVKRAAIGKGDTHW